jgi:hypothetical protein
MNCLVSDVEASHRTSTSQLQTGRAAILTMFALSYWRFWTGCSLRYNLWYEPERTDRGGNLEWEQSYLSHFGVDNETIQNLVDSSPTAILIFTRLLLR